MILSDSPFLIECESMDDARYWLEKASEVRLKMTRDVCTILMFSGRETHVYFVHSTKVHQLVGQTFNHIIINH